MTGSLALRLVLDKGVPRDAAARLRGLGYECIHVGEVGMGKATDEEVLAFSVGRNATVVTLDADFHIVLAVSGASGPSVIRRACKVWAPPSSSKWFRMFSCVSKPI